MTKPPQISGRGPERQGSGPQGTPSEPTPIFFYQFNRFAIAAYYATGDRLVQLAANLPDPNQQPRLRAQAELHRLLNDSITGYGNIPLPNALVDPAKETTHLFVPTANLSLPEHDKDGNPIMEGRLQKSHVIHLPMPLTFIHEELEAREKFNLEVEVLGENPAKFPHLPEADIADLTRLVANRMSKKYDYDPKTNWFSSEAAIRRALAGPALSLPPTTI